MMPPVKWFRLASMLAGLLTGGVGIFANYYRAPGNTGSLAIHGSLLLLWLLALWSLGGRIRQGLSRLEVLVVLFQLGIGFVINMDLSFISCSQIPLYVDRRQHRSVWFGLLLLLTGWAGFVAFFAEFEVSESLKHVPYGLAMALTTLQVLVWSSFAFFAGHLIVVLESSNQRLAWSNGELRGTQQLLEDSARWNERLNISRELHDTIGHHLVSLNLNLEIATHKCQPELRPWLERAQLVARLLLADTREVISTWRAEQPIDLKGAIDQLITALPQLKIHLDLDANVSSSEAQAIFRCCQEAITNALRHGLARSVHIRITRSETSLILNIRDDGRGTPIVQAGNGLRGMQERFEGLGGGLSWASTPQQGFSIEGWLPS